MSKFEWPIFRCLARPIHGWSAGAFVWASAASAELLQGAWMVVQKKRLAAVWPRNVYLSYARQSHWIHAPDVSEKGLIPGHNICGESA
jgi:hypothetical protein